MCWLRLREAMWWRGKRRGWRGREFGSRLPQKVWKRGDKLCLITFAFGLGKSEAPLHPLASGQQRSPDFSLRLDVEETQSCDSRYLRSSRRHFTRCSPRRQLLGVNVVHPEMELNNRSPHCPWATGPSASAIQPAAAPRRVPLRPSYHRPAVAHPRLQERVPIAP